MSAVALYGAADAGLAEAPPGARQHSPFVPGADALETAPTEAFVRFLVAAPPGTIERRFTLAHALRALRPGGEIVAWAGKRKGGERIEAELAAFGLEPSATSRRHAKIVTAVKPAGDLPLAPAIEAGAPRIGADGLWTQPGIFSWDGLDPGSALLIEAIADARLRGSGADFGCGAGALARAVLAHQAVTAFEGIDLDRRAVECARRNVVDPRFRASWRDLRRAPPVAKSCDFIVMNPPFHDGSGEEDRGLGRAFVEAASRSLRAGGLLLMVANRHLPYEKTLDHAFTSVRPLGDAFGFKIIEAIL